jgi:ankyrin repeat protein
MERSADREIAGETVRLKAAIEAGDVAALREALSVDLRRLANAPFRWGENGKNETRPLHYICDKVFDGTISGERAVDLARLLIEAGADIDDRDGDPLTAAASLGATGVGLLLLDAGARTELTGPFGETALHWAATLGNDVLVARMLEKGAPVDIKDRKYNASPLGWALHGWQDATPAASGEYPSVVARLVRAGATVEPAWLADAQARGRTVVVQALRGGV